MASEIKYYPVDNGDQSLITVEENAQITHITIDCNIRELSKDDLDKSKFDVKKDLLKVLKRKRVGEIKDVSYTDIFILTHGDEDHLLGFEKNYYQGDPKNYKQKHKDDGQIFIDVLWFSPMVMGTATNDDEKCFNKEAKRRIQLHRDKSKDKDLPGNRIVIIGNDANEDLSGLDLVRKCPGDVVTRFNERDLKTFSIFIHSPYQQHLTDEEVDKNRVSIVFQARFKSTAESKEFCSLAMFGGDSDHHAWKTILEKTKKYNNHVEEKALDWHLFLAPHHCSWSFFNDTPQEDNPTPVSTSLEILDFKKSGAKVIASSKVIKDNLDNPPHYQAKREYIKKLDNSSDFFNTAIEPKESAPEPIVFEVSLTGFTKVKSKSSEKLAAALSVASSAIIKKPWAR